VTALSAQPELSAVLEDSTGPAQEATSPRHVTTEGRPQRRRSPIFRLMATPIYVNLVLGLSCLFFVVTGIQFWVTQFLVEIIGAAKTTVVPVFGVTAITAPLLGVAFGGWFIDRSGGYKGAEGMAHTLKCCSSFGFVAASAAVGCTFVGRSSFGLPLAVGCIATTLFFGGAIIPAATGVLINSVPPDLRRLAPAGSMFVYQVFGYASAPLFSALVMEVALEAAGLSFDEALKLGFSLVMWWSVLALALVGNAWRVARAATVHAKSALTGSL